MKIRLVILIKVQVIIILIFLVVLGAVSKASNMLSCTQPLRYSAFLSFLFKDRDCFYVV